ncbi:unnamed protein product [Peronospora belbahrii]|uniref:Uncharacterized protein n=1 Tax=Peronospora belbahrii TaxID=622444 RepID=A0AAU9KNH5_9STRA|nr:unnamed protein product [Peronospora belbahrii]CAH0518453.1 unnamed protein product [Peronospora belbahrii]
MVVDSQLNHGVMYNHDCACRQFVRKRCMEKQNESVDLMPVSVKDPESHVKNPEHFDCLDCGAMYVIRSTYSVQGGAFRYLTNFDVFTATSTHAPDLQSHDVDDERVVRSLLSAHPAVKLCYAH